MIIKNALVFGEDKQFEKRDIFIADGRFAPQAGGECIDAEGLYAVPGLVDIHFHGCVGHDFSDADPAGLEAISAYEASVGVTTICPASMSLPARTLTAVCENAAAMRDKLSGAALVGINMEGPFFSLEKKGAQNPDFIIPPNVDLFRRLQAASGGLIKLCDLAPELDGATDFIRQLKGEVVISLAHTAADYAAAYAAIEQGASHVTHLFNGMSSFSHREPNVLGAAVDGGCEAELIADGVHIHPSAVRMAFKLFGDRLILISDSMMATGLADGNYSLGGLPVAVKGNLATLADGTIAGSATNLADCVRTAVHKMDIPLADAIYAATAAPAKSIGIFNDRGSIAPGKVADLLLLDCGLGLRKVILRGAVYA